MFYSTFICLFCIVCVKIITAATTRKEINPKLQLDESKLPKLDVLLDELSIGFKLKDFFKQGIIDTRYLIKLKPMDYQIMEMEWIIPGDDSFTSEHLKQLKDRVKEIIADATIQPDSANSDTNIFNEKSTLYLDLVTERTRYNYGHIYVNNSIQSFEYQLATFGGKTTPIGTKGMAMLIEPSEEHSVINRMNLLSTGCPPPGIINIMLLEQYHKQTPSLRSAVDYKDQYIVVKRGECPFLLKAYHMKALYPTSIGLIVVNHNDQIEAPSSGYGVDPLITEKHLLMFDKLGNNPNYSVLSVSNSSWDRLVYTMFQQMHAKRVASDSDSVVELKLTGSEDRMVVDTHLSIHAIPLKCGYGLSASTSSAKTKANTKKSKNKEKTKQAAKTARSNSKFCRPLLPQEEMIANEVTAGVFSINTASIPGTVESIETTPTGDSSSSSLPKHVEKMIPRYDFLSGYVGGWLPVDRDVGLVLADPIDGCSPLLSSVDSYKQYEGKAIVMKRGVCNFDTKLFHAQLTGGAVVVMVNNPGAGLEHVGINNNQLNISIPSVLVMDSIGLEMIRQLQAETDHTNPETGNSGLGLTIRFEPYYNNAHHLINTQYEHSWDNHTYEDYAVNTQYPTLAHHWIELVHYPWVSVTDSVTYTQALLQVQVLIHKYELFREQYRQYIEKNSSYHTHPDNKLRVPLFPAEYYDSILNWLESKKTRVLNTEYSS